MRMIRAGFLLCIFFLVASCTIEKQWEFEERIALSGIHPIGIDSDHENIWLSDGDNNRLVMLNSDFKTVKILENFERPMHIDISEGNLFVPEYGSDTIRIVNDGKRSDMDVTLPLDAPAGVDVAGDHICIADFYGHRVVFFDSTQWVPIGRKGSDPGELFYPTDCQIKKGKIYIADAYNHRIQVFDFQGNSIQIFGNEEEMNASTGIFLSDDKIFITDFENGRVLIYDYSGSLKQILDQGINKPTDILIYNEDLLITDFESSALVRYVLK